MPAIRYDGNLETSAKNVPLGANAPVYTLPYAIATIYTDSTLTTLVSIFSDQALTLALPNPLTSDSQGRFGFWVNSGYYVYTITDTFGELVGTYSLSLLAGNNGAQGPPGPPATFTGLPYSSLTTYANGDTATTSVGGFTSTYVSVQSGNLNHPLSDTAWWRVVLGAPVAGDAPTTISSYVPSSYGGGTPAGDGVLVDTPFTQAGSLQAVSVKVFSATAGNAVRVFLMNGASGTYGVADFFDVVISTTITTPTTVTWTVGTDFSARNAAVNQFIAFYSAAASFAYGGGDVAPQTVYLLGSEPSGSTPVAWSALHGLSVPFTATTNSLVPTNLATTDYVTDTVDAAIAAIPPASQGTQPRTSLFSQSFPGTSAPANWSGTGWTYNNGAVSPTSGQGYGAILGFASYQNVEQRTIRYTFTPTSSGAIAGFGSIASPSAFVDGASLVTVDGSANMLNICNPFTPGSNPGVLVSVALGFSITSGTTYILTLYQNERELTASITDPVTGIVASVMAGSNATNNGLAAPWDKLNDFPAIVAIAGTFKVLNATYLANAVKPYVYFCGDSITWGVGTPLVQRWASLVDSQLPGFCLVSGRPGGTSIGALARMTTEVQYLLPKYVVILIGTNDNGNGISLSTTLANIASAASIAQGYGATVFVCLLTTSSGNQSWVTSVNNGLVAASMSGVTLIPFNVVTSTDGGGVTQNPALFIGDGTHLNQLGNQRVAACLLNTVPFILD